MAFYMRRGAQAWQPCEICNTVCNERLGTWISSKANMSLAKWICGPCLWLMLNVAGTRIPDDACAHNPT